MKHKRTAVRLCVLLVILTLGLVACNEVIDAVANALEIGFYIVLGLIVLGIIAGIVSVAMRSSSNNDSAPTPQPNKPKNQFHYERKDFLTLSEQAFFEKLKKAVGDQYYVFPQIVLSSVVNKVYDENWKTFQSELNYICDFGLFDSTLRIVALVEYNDQSHYLPDREYRDKSVKRTCERVDIPLITFWTHNRDGSPYPNEIHYIKNRITSLINHQSFPADQLL